MYSLIGDRFLKQFFGSRLHFNRVNLSSEAGSPTENAGDKSSVPGYPPVEDPFENEATLENEQTGKTNQIAGPENGVE